jgi:tetratricopeptide (TPR) repeat protein
MTNPNQDWDEDRLRELLRVAQHASLAPDEEFLARLRAESLAAFQSAAAETGETEARQPGSKPQLVRGYSTSPQPSKTEVPSPRKSRMFIIAWRALAASAAAVVLMASWFAVSNSGSRAASLATVLEKTEAATALHMRIDETKPLADKPRPTEAWSAQGGAVRVNHADGTYDIARQEKLWQVDEKANRAASGTSPYYRAEAKSADLLALLGLDSTARKDLRAATSRPAQQRIGGTLYDVYSYRALLVGRPVVIEACVDPATRLLHSLETLVDRDGKRTPSITLTVLDANKPVDESLFVVGNTLTEDGRIGKVSDVQGMVSIKPVLAERWTPVCGSILLRPGDWLRTDLRGANAVAARLAGKTELVAGPGTLVELMSPKKLRLYEGEIKLTVGPQSTLELLGPGDKKTAVKANGLCRVQNDRLVLTKEDPKWLKGFRGTEVQESIGSLVANVDSRNVPLTMGYHKVTVEIPDQIARTTVEESFANLTDVRMEGVFYFPLPQDASISGFGMWIGNELVEADIVEKQRAREIYETILRERRDPGLLEWSGGNLFKARVFPIEPHAEKRIRIVYTQVLPRTGNTFRYNYALQSEMLRQHPLRELSIDVKINSVVPLKKVASPTHAVRLDQSEHSAHVEFDAQEYTPTRDFEVVAELQGKQPELTLIPHRRGEDGYFMLLLAPPAEIAEDDRDLLTDKEPLDLILLADTSASLDAGQRAHQADFIAAMLQSLTPRDTVNLACCDVQCDWAFEKAAPADAKNIQAVRQFLERRASLGWTDLAKAFSKVFERAGRNTCIVYVGDGIPTTGDGDPAATAAQLRRLYEEKCRDKEPVCHAISVGSTFESGVLKAIGSLGGGSMRQIGGEQGPRVVALDLLKEITRPALRDLKVQFAGLRVARVYPEQLPNLPSGEQQIILGRYLPQGADSSGKVIVTGRQGDRDVRFEKALSLADAEHGNSFIPRLWARMHLDYLLQQGATATIKDDIIALSEDYHIITPYTSLLVLESDADRERFKVKRSFTMRDGEKFFAEGLANADFELRQQQMKRAGSWRIGLRLSVLQQLSGLGRDAAALLGNNRWGFQNGYGWGGGLITESFAMHSRIRGLGDDLGWNKAGNLSFFDGLSRAKTLAAPVCSPMMEELGSVDGDLNASGDLANNDRLAKSELEGESSSEERDDGIQDVQHAVESERQAVDFGPISMRAGLSSRMPVMLDHRRYLMQSSNSTSAGFMAGKYVYPSYGYNGEVDNCLNGLFGSLPRAPAGKQPPAIQRDWPKEVPAISKDLLRTEKFTFKNRGLRIGLHTDNFDARFGELTTQSDTSFLTSARSWLVRDSSDAGQTTVQWCDGQQRELFNRSFQLGRARKAVEAELKTPAINLEGFVLTSLESTFAGQKVTLRHPADGQALLVFRVPGNDKNETRVLVDTKRNVVLSIEQRSGGKATATQQFGDFTEAAGAWWAGSIKSLDDKGRVVRMASQKIASLDNNLYPQSMEKERAGREQVQFLRDPAETVLEAKKALAAGKATFDDQATLLMHFARSGQWSRAMDHLAAAEKLAADPQAGARPGLRWLRYAVLKLARRNEELKALLLQEAGKLAEASAKAAPSTRSPDELYLANYLLGQANGVLEANEMLALLDALQKVYARQPAHLHSLKGWKQQLANYLASAGQSDESLAIFKELAEAYPRDFGAQTTYVQNLQNRQEYEAERKWIDRELASDVPWLPQEIEQFRGSYAQSLSAQERYEELVAYRARWIEQNPENASPYTQYIDALYYNDRSEDATARMARWFREGRRDDAPPAAIARLHGAIDWIFNQCNINYNYYGGNHIDQRWQDELAETTVFFCRSKTQVSISEKILNDWRFQQVAANQKARAELAKIFAATFDRLPMEEIDRFINWLRGNDLLVTKAQWKDYARRLRERYAAEPEEELKNHLAQTVANILSFAADADEYMAFLRQLSREAPEKYRPYYVSQLFQTLLTQPWSEKYENEAFDLLGRLGGGQSPQRQLSEQVRALYQLTDHMLKARKDAKAKTIEHAEKLTRTELLKKQSEQLRQTREEFAARLAREEAKHGSELATWIAAERIYIDVLLNRNLDKAAETCWKVLDVPPPKLDESPDDAAAVRAELNTLLRNRCLMTLMNLTARKTASPELVRRTLDYLVQNIGRELAAQSQNQQWKLLKFVLLVALDRPKDLQASLDDWIKAGDADNRWRVALGYLLAEEGKLDQAIGLFESIAAADELGAGEWRTLSDWHQAMKHRAECDRAKIEIYKTEEEWRLSQLIYAQMQPWVYNQGQLPSQLDPEAVLAFRALLSKSAAPQNYIGGQLRELYKACRDFRLLSCLADSIPGHTAGQIYPYLQSARGVIDEIRDEAAVDSLSQRLAELQAKAATDVDRRAFDLLEVMTERRAAELRNQPGPHVDKAVAALRRAFKRQWASGEEKWMADFLAALGAIPQEKLAAEQLRQLEAFYNNAKPDTQQRLDMACAYAKALWSYNRRQGALDLLEAEVNRYRSAGHSKPLCEQPVFQDYISYLDQAGRYTEAVKRLEHERQQAEKMQNRRNLEARVLEVHLSALRNRGQVGDLKGAELYRAVQDRILGQLPCGDSPFDARLITLLSGLFDAAHGQNIAGVSSDAKAFAFKTLPALLARQVQQYENLVNDLCERVHQVCNPADGIAFLLDRYERRPQWLKIKQNFWNAYGARLNNWRREAKSLDAALSDRLLKLVLDYLRDELLVRRTYNMPICYKSYPGEFWAEREADFLRFAEETYAQNKISGTVTCNVADYLVQGLGRMDRAIEILQAAQEKHLLDEGGQAKLVNYLHNRNRFGESIGLLQALVEAHPANLEYRRLLMVSYFRTTRKDDLLTLLKQTDEYFHAKDRWGQNPLAMLAGSCLQTELFEQSLGYYKELIPLHERTAANRGIGDGTLSGYYGGEAQALAGLKRTSDAVEAACGAIISWGTNVQNRAQALEALRNVVGSCEKLDAYVAELDAQVAKTKTDNAFVRKAVGQVYQQRGQLDNAVTQLNLAREVQPNDREIYEALVACCDKRSDKQGAIRELLAWLQSARRDINLYKDLGRRLAELHEDREAERAYTSIVEVLASEAESHAMLAEVRESQNRWAEAIDEWRQAARLRALEPTNLLRLAAAQIHEKCWTAAEETVKQLRGKAWPPRFVNIESQIQQLEQQIRQGREER